MARRWSFRAAASVRKARPPTSRRFRVITLLRQPWQRPCVPSGICRRPCSNTKQPPLLFPSRLHVTLTAGPPPRSGSPQAAGCRGQISGWKARATFIRAHSCPFVVHRHPCVSFASSRLRVRPAACKTPSPQRQSAVSRSQRADLGLESPSYVHSCPFVSIRGSTSPLRFLRVFASSREAHVAQTPFPRRQSAVSRSQRADLGLESPSCVESKAAIGDTDVGFSHAKTRRKTQVAAVGGSSSTSTSTSTSTPHIRVHSWFKTPPPRSPFRTDLGLESPSYLHSRSFVFHSASGGVSPLVTALTSVLWLQPQRRAAPSPCGETELSRHPRHATAVDDDSDLPFPHTRDATTPLCSTVVCWGPDFRESSVRTAGQR
jgi:hypothetical protein